MNRPGARPGRGDETTTRSLASDRIRPAHAPYQLLPPLNDEEYAALRADIAEHGIRSTILDGRIRYLACQAAGVEPTYTTAAPDLTDDQAVELVISLNGFQVWLSRDQRAVIGAEARALADGGGADG